MVATMKLAELKGLGLFALGPTFSQHGSVVIDDRNRPFRVVHLDDYGLRLPVNVNAYLSDVEVPAIFGLQSVVRVQFDLNDIVNVGI